MDLSELLRERGMRVTSQRLLIERALREHGGHLTAEQVHDLVEPALPGVTQQTVYSTLALLADLGVARRAWRPGHSPVSRRPRTPITTWSARAAARSRTCTRACRSPRPPRAAREAGFVPDSAGVTVLGLCARCAAAS